MKKLIACFSLIALTLTSVHAMRLTPPEALSRALERAPARSVAQSAPRDYKLQYARNNAVYLFAAPGGGYLAVSGDDSAPAILAYSDGGEFDSADIPPAMQAWLDDMAEQITAISRGAASRGESPARDAIAPMITTKWNQGDPFNRMCPVGRNSERCLTGCTATAMSQIMNYHQWPVHGDGQISYKTFTDGYQVDADFSAMTFDWTDMADTYTSDSPEAECNAVAQLMFAAGAAAEADYLPGATATYTTKAARALHTNFGYDKGLRVLNGEFYTVGHWEKIVYESLKNDGPVLYSGNPPSGKGSGHTYVCDGYSDGYFHINWGWGGHSDGYFLLSALNPEEGKYGYSSTPIIVTGIARPREGSSVFSQIVNFDDLYLNSLDSSGDDFRVLISGRFENRTADNTYSGKLGLRLTASGGAEYVFMEETDRSMKTYHSVYDLEVKIDKSIPDGRYSVIPVYQLGEETLDIPTPPLHVGKLILDKSESSLQFSTFREHSDVRAENVTIETPLYIDCPFKISASLKNTGDMTASVRAVPILVNSEKRYVGGADPYFAVGLQLDPGESEQISVTGYLESRKNYNLPSGQYTLYIANAYRAETVLNFDEDDFLSDGIPVTVKAKPAETIRTVTRFKVENENNVDPDNVSLSWRITCNKGYYTGKLQALVYAAEGGYPLAEVPTDQIFLEQGQTRNMTLTFPLTGTGASGRYWAALLDLNNYDWATEQYYFTTAGSTGLPALSTEHAPRVFPTVTDGMINIAGDNISSVSVYSIAGTLQLHTEGSPSTIDLSPLSSGIYLVRLEGDNPAVFKVIRK